MIFISIKLTIEPFLHSSNVITHSNTLFNKQIKPL